MIRNLAYFVIGREMLYIRLYIRVRSPQMQSILVSMVLQKVIMSIFAYIDEVGAGYLET